MSRRAIAVLACLLIVCGALQAQETPQAIIKRAIKVMGGEENLALQYAQVAKFKGKIDFQPGEAVLEGVMSSAPEGKQRLESKVKVLGMELEVCVLLNGKEGWRCANGTWEKVPDEEFSTLQASRHVEDISSLVPLLRDKEYKLELLPETEVEKKKAVGIKVSRQGKPDVSLFFEKETGLLCKASYQKKSRNTGKDEPYETIAGDYREVDWAAQTEETLKKVGLPTDAPALLALVRKRTPTREQLEQARALIQKLGDDSFDVREQADKDLVKLGPVAVPALEKAARADDAEIARRAREIIKTIEEQHNPATLRAAIRLLGLRRSEGAVEALLAYLPGAEKETAEEVRAALLGFAQAKGGQPPELVKALEDRDPIRRDAARAVLGKDGGAWLNKPGRPIFPVGLKLPFKFIAQEGEQPVQKLGNRTELEILHVELFNRLDDKLFAKPTE